MNSSLKRASRNVCQCQYSVGNHSGGKVNTGAVSGLSAAVSIQPTGNRMNRLARTSKAYTKVACSNRGRRGKRGALIGFCSVGCTTLLLGLVEDEITLGPQHDEDHDHADDREDPG